MLKDLILQNRSCRRFHQESAVEGTMLCELVDLARLSASGANRQPLKFALSTAPAQNARIFPCLHWAAYLKEWAGPGEGERPAAYVIILGDKEIADNFGVDHGIAAQSIMLGAVERGLRGCIMSSIERGKLCEILGLPDRYEILLVLALGSPAETVVVDAVAADENIRYWRDAESVHHVPKRSLEDLILAEWQ